MQKRQGVTRSLMARSLPGQVPRVVREGARFHGMMDWWNGEPVEGHLISVGSCFKNERAWGRVGVPLGGRALLFPIRDDLLGAAIRERQEGCNR